MAVGQASGEVREGELLWTPSAERAQGSNLSAFVRWLRDERGLRFDGYDELWRWSVGDLDAFWQAVWDYFEVGASAPPTGVLASRAMPGARWFPGARLNFAEHLLRRERPGSDALLFCSETAPLTGMPWETLAGQVRVLATWLREAGVAAGDRVVSFMPNIPHTVVAMLATTGIGAVWASCSPDFGWRGVLDRFQQLEPKVLFGVDAVARLGCRPRAAGRAGRRLRVRAGCLRPPAVDAVHLRHHRPAEGDRPRARRDPAGAAQAADLPPRPASGRAPVLLHHDRLDDVELPGVVPGPRRDPGAVRRQPRPPGPRRPVEDHPGQPRRPGRRQPRLRGHDEQGRHRPRQELRPVGAAH